MATGERPFTEKLGIPLDQLSEARIIASNNLMQAKNEVEVNRKDVLDRKLHRSTLTGFFGSVALMAKATMDTQIVDIDPREKRKLHSRYEKSVAAMARTSIFFPYLEGNQAWEELRVLAVDLSNRTLINEILQNGNARTDQIIKMRSEMHVSPEATPLPIVTVADDERELDSLPDALSGPIQTIQEILAA